jgi:hypothetical protein
MRFKTSREALAVFCAVWCFTLNEKRNNTLTRTRQSLSSRLTRSRGGKLSIKKSNSTVRKILCRDKKQVLFWRLTNIRCHGKKFNLAGDLAPRICAPCPEQLRSPDISNATNKPLSTVDGLALLVGARHFGFKYIARENHLFQPAEYPYCLICTTNMSDVNLVTVWNSMFLPYKDVALPRP